MTDTNERDIAKIAEGLDRTRRIAMLTRDGMGEYSSTTYRKLSALGLVDHAFRLTDLGQAVRNHIIKDSPNA